MALLTAASTDRFRAVFSFGPIDDIRYYGTEALPFDTTKDKEVALRSPMHWMNSMQGRVLIFEGTDPSANIEALRTLASSGKDNPLVDVYPVEGANHFNIVAPVTASIASKILQDTDAQPELMFTATELNSLFQ